MFAHPEYLYLLFFIPVFFFLFIVRLRADRRRMEVYMQDTCLKAVAGFSNSRRRIQRHFILLMMFLFLILALARLQSETEAREVEIKGAEVMLLADVSNSMLVKDMGGFSRLEVMKKELDKLISLLAGQRVGLISFSGKPLLVSPLTLDHTTLKLFVKTLSPGAHIEQGTDFGGALQSAIRALKRGSALPPNSPSRVALIASDGEDNEKEALMAVEELARQNIRVFTLGFGTDRGGMIPVYNAQGEIAEYKKDQHGNPIISRFDEKTLRKIARTANGAFYSVSLGSNTMEKVFMDIQKAGEGVSAHHTQHARKEWYQYFVLMAILCGFLYFFIGEKGTVRSRQWQSYLRGKA